MFINLKIVFFLNRVIDARKILHVYIKNVSAIFTLKVIMVINTRVVSLQSTRQGNLPYSPVFGKQPEIAVYGGFAYGRILCLNFRVHFLDRRVIVQFLQSAQYNLALQGISLHTME